jgi:23S rRNA (adenine2030-N6)-methyltransferase
MNYRHGFHAGNFADVHKHAALVLLLLHLRKKPAPFRVIDTHAGAGRYDLASEESARTGEWLQGIGKLRTSEPTGAAADLLNPLLNIVAKNNPDGELKNYPGSPLIAAELMRPQDRLIACELEPGSARTLSRNVAHDRRVKPIQIDGWTGLTAYIPPKERRGLVLIDPAFEAPDEFERLGEALVSAHRKWPTGICLAWYPIKDLRGRDALADRIRSAAAANCLRSELLVSKPAGDAPLAGSGLLLINPPWLVDEQLKTVGAALAKALGRDRSANARLDWITKAL